MTATLEIVTFALNPGTDEAAFLRAAEAAGAALKAMPGFVARRLGRGEDGAWVDVAEWTDMASAKRAAETFHTLPAAQPFCAMIDMATARMAHHAVAAAS
ncbi:MAG TPA: hypothetical protein VEH84_11720 [Alphaproteobacteria bacterium]|nr:hypothetical protein [Alphaproteobacteria bacterium]